MILLKYMISLVPLISLNFALSLISLNFTCSLGVLNSEPTESAVRDFCEICSCKNLIKDNTSFRNPLKPSLYIDLIINRPKSYQNSVRVETELSDFYKMTSTVMKVI